MSSCSRRGLLTGLGGALLAGGMAKAAPLASIAQRGELKVAVYRDFAPWSYRRGDQLVGVDVDLGGMIAKSLGAPVSYLELPAGETLDDDLRNAVWRGSVLGSPVADLMLHVPVDQRLAARNDKTLIGAPYYREAFLLASTSDCSAGPQVLDGLKIGVELDSAPDFYMLGAFGGKFRDKVVHFPDGAEAAAAMAKGEVEAVLATRAQVQYGLEGYSGPVSYYAGVLPGLGRSSWPVGLAVRADSTDLLQRANMILSAASGHGLVDQIFQAHGVTYSAPEQA